MEFYRRYPRKSVINNFNDFWIKIAKSLYKVTALKQHEEKLG